MLAVLSPSHMVLFAVVVLLLFGSRLPSTMRSLGKSVNEFKKGLKEGAADTDDDEADAKIESSKS